MLCVQLASYLERGPLMWMMPLHLHVNQKSDYDYDMKNQAYFNSLSTSLSADNLCKQFGPRSDPTNVGLDLDPNFLTLWWYPGIQFRLPCTPPPQDNFSWVPNCSLGPPGWETKVSSKQFWFGLCEIAWFLCQPIANLRRGVCL